ncbi:MAG: MotA/TolQ/ExbB proton channel family protein [Phycisphaerae bacterium]|nr:MotA/TolQ/ExbB proton channel family protein [Phycisphaerae bacterium]
MNKTFIKISLLTLFFAVVAGIAFFSSNVPAQPQVPSNFFEQFVVAGGPIVWVILLPMSLVTAYLGVKYAMLIRRKNLLPLEIGKDICNLARSLGYSKLVSQLGKRDDLVSAAVCDALIKGKDDWYRAKTAMAESMQDQAMRLTRKIEWINLIGNVSPMVGLFGTVFGMIKLFNAIVLSSGRPQPVQLAAGISVALVTTFWGLLVAIPALAVHGIFRNRIESIFSKAIDEAEKILPVLKSILSQRKVDAAQNIANKSQNPKTSLSVNPYVQKR